MYHTGYLVRNLNSHAAVSSDVAQQYSWGGINHNILYDESKIKCGKGVFFRIRKEEQKKTKRKKITFEEGQKNEIED